MVNPIMTNTLPTVIGMGVVSRASETMFSKNGRGGRRRGKARPVKIRGRAVSLHRGPRGGTYVIRKGRKVYLYW